MVGQTGLAVDLDIFHEKTLVQETQRTGIRRVSSYHNYLCIPTIPELQSIIAQLRKGDPFAVKIACTVSSEQDGARMLSFLTQEKIPGERLIVSAMGSQSLPVRILGGVWGSAWIYAPLDESDKTAEGQLSASEVRKLLSLLGCKD